MDPAPHMHHFVPYNLTISPGRADECVACGQPQVDLWHADPQYPADVQLPGSQELWDFESVPLCGCVPAPKVTAAIVIEAHTLERIEEIVYHHPSAPLTVVRHVARCRPDTCGWVGEEWPTEGDARHEYAQHLAELIEEHAS